MILANLAFVASSSPSVISFPPTFTVTPSFPITFSVSPADKFTLSASAPPDVVSVPLAATVFPPKANLIGPAVIVLSPTTKFPFPSVVNLTSGLVLSVGFNTTSPALTLSPSTSSNLTFLEIPIWIVPSSLTFVATFSVEKSLANLVALKSASTSFPIIFNAVPNALCVVPAFALKSSPAWATACKSLAVATLFNPSALVTKSLITALASSLDIGLS